MPEKVMSRPAGLGFIALEDLVYGAPGGFDGLPFDRANAEPTATHAPATSPAFIRKDRFCRCFAGAIAAPTVREAGAPLTAGAFAPAAPEGTELGLCGCTEELSGLC